MDEMLYDVNAGLIAVLLLVSMFASIEVGQAIGRRRKTDEASRKHVDGIQGSILGLLALLLAFALSLALQRFDNRSAATVDEANAIGTAWLRTQLLGAAQRDEAQTHLREYIDLRVSSGNLSQVDREQREPLMKNAERLQSALWTDVRHAMETQPGSYAPMLYAQAVNAVIDAYGTREAGVRRHVPEVVLLLLYGTFLIVGALVGYSSGISAHRPSLASYLMVTLIVVLVFVILDLDRPQRGLITVSQESLTELQQSIRAETKTPPAVAR
jgi:hypothetical protein